LVLAPVLALAFFFDRFATATFKPNPLAWSLLELIVQFFPTATDRIDIQPGDLGHCFDPAVAQFLGFQGGIPPPLLFVQPAQKQVHPAMFFFQRMPF
jgi:hypothetical protein